MSGQEIPERSKQQSSMTRSPREPPCDLNENGLPLRPHQTICPHYNRFGLCKLGPTCRFDHSTKPPSSDSKQ
ncbi:hypothetical protein IGI04_027338 [Brassica rapa subsp. trilocularis]|uniref:C3H1-type domain-containing protein n=1 Tax=Brassica rapa subsp. trilocularis TaxID=1813537 RepID=A0ABQ7L155_BRACM|nr:hypothetical protein IGI04_027338 [Brassica rapa subsp. trilocularis]